MAFSAAALKLLMARSSKEVWLWLLTIDHADLPAPIRWVRNNEDIVSNGETFAKCDFEIIPPGMGGRNYSARLGMPNVSREIGFALTTMDGAADVLFQVCLASTPDTIELNFEGFTLRNVGWDAIIAEGELSCGSDDDEPYPKIRVTPGGFPPWFA